MANKVLGRGLKELFEENTFDIDKIRDGEVIVNVNLEDIKPNPFQPRKIFNQEKIDDLASSIKEHGVFQPIILKQVNEGYIIVSGERRFRASKQVGLDTIPSIIRNYDSTMVQEIALIENLQREDLTPIEEAEAYKSIIENLSYTQKDLAVRIGKSRSYVTNILGLLSLPKEVQKMLLEEEISMGHARALSKLKDEKKIIELAKKIVDRKLSVRQIEDLTQEEEKAKEIKKREPKNPKYIAFERKLKNKYGSNFRITDDKVVIKDVSNDKLLEIIRCLLGE